jgi:hypothetical protein
LADRFEKIKEYKAHINQVMSDRALESSLKSMNPLENSRQAILFCQTDGMDQAKWSVPRSPGWVQSKSAGRYERPRLKVQGVWMHWLGLFIFVGDPHQPHDSSMTIECITRALERVIEHCRVLGAKEPSEFLLWVQPPV